jgi:hypothetical protein
MSAIPMRQKVTIENPSGRAKNGSALYAPPVEAKARLVEGQTLTIGRDNSDVTAKVTIYLGKDTAVDVEARLTYEDENGTSRTYTVVNVETKRGRGGKVAYRRVFAR